MSMLRMRGRSSSTAAVIAILATVVWAAEGGEAPKDTPPDRLLENVDVQKTTGPQDAETEVIEAPIVKKAADVKLRKEPELRERVQARWDAVIKGELDKAYGFETPEYRKAHSKKEHEQAFGRRVRWHVATLKDLGYDRADDAEAIIALDYSFALPGSDEMVRTTGVINERWVYTEDQWWRQDTARPLVGNLQSQPSLDQ